MWPFKKRHPFTHNPEDFKLRIVPAWFSNDWINFEYSANGGRTWKKVYGAYPPFLGSADYDWKWEPVHYQLGNGEFTAEKGKFSSYQKILDFEKKEEIEYHNGVEAQELRRANIKKNKQEAYNRANS